MKSKLQAIASALAAMCVLCALFLNAASPDAAPGPGSETERGAAAVRYLPVYSSLNGATVKGSFEIDTSHGGEGYVAASAKSAENVKIKIISPDGAQRFYNVPNTGLVSYYPLSDGNGRYVIQLMEQIGTEPGGDAYRRVCEEVCDATLFDEFQPFLRPSTYVWFSGYSACVNAAAQLCAGESDDDRKIERIRDYVCAQLRYDAALAETEDQSYIRDPDLILARGTGICLDYAALTAAMLRSQGIPAKVVYGGVDRAEGYHAWNMVYSSSRGWFRVDATFADNGVEEAYISDDSHYTELGFY